MERVSALPRRLRVAFLSTFVRTVQKIILMSILIFYLLKWSASSIRRASRQVKKEYWVKVTPLDWWKKEWSNKNNHTLIILINTFPLFCQVRGCTGSKKETADQQKFHLHGWIRFNSGQRMALVTPSSAHLWNSYRGQYCRTKTQYITLRALHEIN